MRKAVRYSIAVCLISWAAFAVLYAACHGDVKSHRLLLTGFESLYMLLPMAVAMILQKLDGESFHSTGFLDFKPRWSWIWASVIPLAAVAGAILISALLPGVRLHYGAEQLVGQMGLDATAAEAVKEQLSSIPPVAFIGSQVISGLLAGCTINAIFAFGEEYGWRNYLLSSLEGYAFWKKALFIGLIWGIWHAPLILQGHNYPQHPVAGVAMMCVECILLGAIELKLVLSTRSVATAAICHGTFNALTGLSLILVEGGNDLTIGLTGVAGFVTLALICIPVCLLFRSET